MIILLLIVLLAVNSVSACEDATSLETDTDGLILSSDVNHESDIKDNSSDLEMRITNAKNGDNILINPDTYYINNIMITKNLTIQGNGNPEDIVLDGRNISSIFLIRNDNVFVTFKNLTFINGFTENFGGAISMETGHVYVDNCHFINNTALNNTNAGAISNYGNETHKGYLFVNNSLFINNHADHDGGAITTCYAHSDIYNSVFINNTAHRDGGAIRVSVQGYANVEDCIFMYNRADEWGGAYYSWSGTSNINRCIFMNNTGGTNGGAIMVSGNLNLENSVIVNNTGEKTGGSFYIQEPMYQAKTNINVHNNLITNNSSPKGQEIYIKWRHADNLYPDFNDNDWGAEDPNDYRVNDPRNVTSRIKVQSTTDKSNLLDELNFNLLNKFTDLISDYFPEGYLDKFQPVEPNENNNQENNNPSVNPDLNNNSDKNVSNNNTINPGNGTNTNSNTTNNNTINPGNGTNTNSNTTNNNTINPGNGTNTNSNTTIPENTTEIPKETNTTIPENTTEIPQETNTTEPITNETTNKTNTDLSEILEQVINETRSSNLGENVNENANLNENNNPASSEYRNNYKNDEKAYELNKTPTVAKTSFSSFNLLYVGLALIIALSALIYGYKREKNR
ncbi:hypothetical protein [Methanobrevibacter sp. YE315]|uniref:hypothetical protein n=1 Tax=Methanobrevibacter sp. YE315 TaxID=1609968 RepID=UPI00082E9211|nr:hypothetical protein [Methanobrevibacter sp. YE315]